MVRSTIALVESIVNFSIWQIERIDRIDITCPLLANEMQFSDRQQIECSFVGWSLFDSIGHEWIKQPKNSRQSHESVRNSRKIANKLKTGASGVVNANLFVTQRMWKLQPTYSRLCMGVISLTSQWCNPCMFALSLQGFHFPSDLQTCFNNRAREFCSLVK